MMRPPLSVFIVHPESGVAHRIARAVTAAGHAPVVLPDGERAIDRFVQEPADAIIVDLVLPGRDGAATIESIRWAPTGDRVAVILTGTAETNVTALEEVGRRVGAIATLAGPIEETAIMEILGRIAKAPPPSAGETRIASSTDAYKVVRDVPQLEAEPDDASDANDVDDSFEEELLTDVERNREREQEGWPADESQSAAADDDPSALDEGHEVEKSAAAIGVEDLGTLEGDLASTPFPRLLCKLADGRATGALVVVSDGDPRRTTTGETPKKIVYFRSGVPVYVKSNLVTECLGQVLARSGKITAHALDESVQRMRGGEGRQGAILIEMGALAPRDLREALEEQLRVKLYDLFSWPNGSYRFSSHVLPPPEIVTLELGLSEIVYQGVVRKVRAQRLLALLAPHLDQFVVPERARMARFTQLELLNEVRRALYAIDGTQRLRELLTASGKRPGAVAQLVHAMECVGAVRFTDAPQRTIPLNTEDAKHEVSENRAMRDIGALREELTNAARLLRAERYAEVLGVAIADTAAARRAALDLLDRWKPVTQPGAAPRELRALAFEVCARLVRASDAISPKQIPREGGTGQTMVARPGAVEGGHSPEDTFDDEASFLLEPRSSAGVPVVRAPSAAHKTGRSGRFREVATVELKVDSDEDEDSLIAPATPEPTPMDEGPDSLGEPLDFDAPVLAREPEPSTQTDLGGDDVSSVPPVSGEEALAEQYLRSSAQLPEEDATMLDERVERMFEAERLFRRGEKALSRGKYTEARDAFQQAVDLCPDQGDFLVHLGWARHLAAPDDDSVLGQSLDEIRRGCQLAPKLYEGHLYEARVLSKTPDIAGARGAYERALAANPDSKEALDELRALRSA